MRKLFTFLSILLIAFTTNLAIAQKTAKVGFFAGYNSNMLSTNFQSLPNIPNCCPEFTNDNGLGYNFGMLFQYPISNSIYIGWNAGVFDLYSQLSAVKTESIMLAGVAQAGAYENLLDFYLTAFTLEPNLSINIFDNLYIQAGLGMLFPASHQYQKIERVFEPNSEATFIDINGDDSKSNERNKAVGTFNDLAYVLFSGKIGMYYETPINEKKTVFFAPGLYYNFGITNVIKDYDWKINNLQVSLSIKWSMGASTSKINKSENRTVVDTIRIANKGLEKDYLKIGKAEVIKSNSETDKEIIELIITRRTDTLFTAKSNRLIGDISIYGIDTSGNVSAKPQFISEEFISNRNQPLLNYVFFDSASYEIPQRYNLLNSADSKTFKIEALSNKSNIETYYNLLNIIGYRLAINNSAKITIKGCNAHIGSERWNQILSRNRANTVANYLTTVWGIDKSRMEIIAQNLPDNFSFPSNLIEKAQENRRVEIYSDNYEILSPIFVADTAIKNTPPIARFIINASAEVGLKKWGILVNNQTEAGSYQMMERGNGIPPKQIDVSLEKITNYGYKENQFYYSLQLTDAQDGDFSTQSKQFEIDKISIERKRKEKKGDLEIERFNLILFDFTSDVLNSYNQSIITKVKSKLNSNSNIRIVGYTDQSGDEKDNQRLSLRRAEAAYKAIGRKDAIVEGLGESVLLYDNSYPEGRIYSRTVEIILETPIK